MALLIGFVLVSLLGVGHHFGLRTLDWLTGSERHRRSSSLLGVFVGLLVLHTAEILAFAVAYSVLLDWPWMGRLTGDYDGSWSGLIYFSGINFTTVGYTQIETSGPIRLVAMMESLGGFMVLTWSATFIYQAWSNAFRK